MSEPKETSFAEKIAKLIDISNENQLREIADEFGVGMFTIKRWYNGDALPATFVQDQVIKYLNQTKGS
jgi:hypothetical protein